MPITTISFDLGGVVVTWDPAKIVANFIKSPRRQAQILEGIFHHPDWAEKDRGLVPEAELEKRFGARTGLTQAEVRRLLDAARESLSLKTDTVAWMDELRGQGFRLFGLSNMPQDHYRYLRERFDFWERFEGLLISSDIAWVKPEPEIFEQFLSRFNLHPLDCIFIDDSQANINAAGELGIRGIRFTDTHQARDSLAVLLAAGNFRSPNKKEEP